ncbi:helix-turn-helix domain-containing protein [Synechococcus lacustris Tous-12m]
MTAYSLAVQADVRKRMSPPNRQDVPQISKELGIHQSTLYKWRSNWRLQGRLCQHPIKTQIAGVLQINSRWCLKQLGSMPLSSVATAENVVCSLNR